MSTANASALPRPAATTGIARVTRHLPAVARTVLGLALVVFGLNYFVEILPRPTTPPPPAAGEFAFALFETGYMFPLIKGTELVVGLLLVANLFVPLALVVLAPVVVNIVAFHAFLAPDGTGIVLAIAAVTIYLAWHHRAAYRALFAPRARL